MERILSIVASVLHLGNIEIDIDGNIIETDELNYITQLLNISKDSMILMHPLPRLDEIPVEIDSSPKAIYFKTVKNSVKVRMSIIKWCFE